MWVSGYRILEVKLIDPTRANPWQVHVSDTPKEHLGRLISVHPLAPAYVQRAVFIAILSFLFFLAMMLAYYIRKSFGYFLLATAFLIVYLVMMFSWFFQRKAVVHVFENGIRYRNHSLAWQDMLSISEASPFVIALKNGKRLELSSSIADLRTLARHIR